MPTSIEAQGVTVEEAIQVALNQLGVTRDRVEIEILHHPRSGFLGLGARRAKVRATVREAFLADGEEYDMSTGTAVGRGGRRSRRSRRRRGRGRSEGDQGPQRGDAPREGRGRDEARSREEGRGRDERGESRSREDRDTRSRDREGRGEGRGRDDRSGQRGRGRERRGREGRDDNRRSGSSERPRAHGAEPTERRPPRPEPASRPEPRPEPRPESRRPERPPARELSPASAAEEYEGEIGTMRGAQESVESSEQGESTVGRARVVPTDELRRRAETVLAEMLKRMGFQATVDSSFDEREGEVVVTVGSDAEGLLIGRRGQTLDALEHLVNRMALAGETAGDARIAIDVGGYRQRRRDTLLELADRLKVRALTQGRRIQVSPMSPRDRRVLQTALGHDDSVRTRVLGTGFYRRVLISPVGLEEETAPLDAEDEEGADAAHEAEEEEGV
jgi:spoIIIJ-associated protein